MKDIKSESSIFSPLNQFEFKIPDEKCNKSTDSTKNTSENEHKRLRFSESAIYERYGSTVANQDSETINSNYIYTKTDSLEKVLVDSHSLRNISFLNDVRHVVHRSLNLLMVRYSNIHLNLFYRFILYK